MHKTLPALVSLLLTLNCAAAPAKALQPEVKAFQENAENCQHFSGEWDSSISHHRQKEIEAAVDRYCGLALQQQKMLKEKYPGNQQLEKILAEYDL
ncbi:hypothetical protein N5923_17705 [Erwiniaceae bacterium BAC15a-03b]|uniref:Uncharacterized protein n=1 Tax=Winslowiella arboricola TaxID=2978220 RepID=A0A9J6PSD9_9GAMM|nr:hypothetical protein [Winslowiella arboricola]MCU5775827.1 hypothetical protein [Winslowiella arboricola]MCU5779323.1 hypothetical protein [Winslowiella arboricola]